MPEQINVGIIGQGRSGWGIHVGGVVEHDAFRLAAVADPDVTRLERAQEKCPCNTYQDHESLLADPDVQLVVIATPSTSHASIAVEAMEAGKDVLVDKPMAVSVAEADTMIAAAERTGRLLTIFQNRRFDADFQKVRDVIDSGVLGPIHFVRRANYGYQRRNDWQAMRKYGGGMLNNWGAHLLDQVYVLMDKDTPESFGDARLTVAAGDAEDQAIIFLRGGPFPAQVEIFSSCSLPQTNWLVIGSYGTLTVTGSDFTMKTCDPNALPAQRKMEEIPPAAEDGYPAEKIEWQEVSGKIEGGKAESFYDCLAASLRDGAPLAVKPDECREVLRIIEDCKQKSGFA